MKNKLRVILLNILLAWFIWDLIYKYPTDGLQVLNIIGIIGGILGYAAWVFLWWVSRVPKEPK